MSKRRRGSAPISYFDERAHNRTDHVFEEARTRNLICKDAPAARKPLFGPNGSRHRSGARSDVSAFRLKAGEVVFAEQLARRFVHRREIELPRDVPRKAAL